MKSEIFYNDSVLARQAGWLLGLISHPFLLSGLRAAGRPELQTTARLQESGKIEGPVVVPFRLRSGEWPVGIAGADAKPHPPLPPKGRFQLQWAEGRAVNFRWLIQESELFCDCRVTGRRHDLSGSS